MMRYLDSLFADKPAWIVSLVALAMLTTIGLLDYLTGYEISLFLFFAIPVVLVTWYSGRKQGCLFSALSILTWAAADMAAGHRYSHEWIFFWNGSMRLLFFLMAAYWTSDIRELLARLNKLANIDGLTSCLNAFAFHEKCEFLLTLSRRMNQPVTLGFIDLDNFKSVNDKQGHAEGNRILKAVADAMIKSVRATDIVGRLGGDEFAIMLPNTDADQARIVFEQLRSRISGEVSSQAISLSIGVVTFHSPSLNADRAISLADNLMYRVKRSGKNNIVYEAAP